MRNKNQLFHTLEEEDFLPTHAGFVFLGKEAGAALKSLSCNRFRRRKLE
jgi:hypothetical protein